MKEKEDHITRRELLKGAAGIGMAGAMSPLAGFANYKVPKKGLIVDENKKEGTKCAPVFHLEIEPKQSKSILFFDHAAF